MNITQTFYDNLATQYDKLFLESITDRLAPGSIFMASIRDYDALLTTKPPYSPPCIHKAKTRQRVSFQTWH